MLGTIAIDEEPGIAVAADDDQLTIEVTTYGGGCHAHHADDVDVDPFRREIVIRPYDRITGDVCTDELVEIQHRVTVRPPDGDWIVRVIGFDRRPSAPVDPDTWEPPRLEVEIPVTLGGPIEIGIPNPAD